MTLQFFKFFQNKDRKTSLDRALSLGLITQEEKLRLEADRSGKRLEKFLLKANKKRKHS